MQVRTGFPSELEYLYRIVVIIGYESLYNLCTIVRQTVARAVTDTRRTDLRLLADSSFGRRMQLQLRRAETQSSCVPDLDNVLLTLRRLRGLLLYGRGQGHIR